MIVTGLDDFCGLWLHARIGGSWLKGSGTCVGWWDGKNITAAVSFTQWNRTSLHVDIASDMRMIPRELLRFIGKYAFVQLEAKALILVTDSNNLAAQRLHKGLGAELQAIIPGVALNGADSLISVLTPECPLWKRLNGDEIRPAAEPGLRAAADPGEQPQSASVELSDSSEPADSDRADRLVNVDSH